MKLKPFWIGCALVTMAISALYLFDIISPATFLILSPAWLLGLLPIWGFIGALIVGTVTYARRRKHLRAMEQQLKDGHDYHIGENPFIAVSNNIRSYTTEAERENRRGNIFIILVLAGAFIALCMILWYIITQLENV